MTIFDAQGRPVRRVDSSPASIDGPFVVTLDDPSLALARLLQDSPEVAAALSAAVVELVCREFGDGATPADRRKRGLAPQFLAGEQANVLVGDGTRPTISEPLDEALDDARGTIFYRGQSLWLPRAPGAANYLLKTLGVDADPVWARSPGAIPRVVTVFTGGATNTSGAFGVLTDAKYLDVVLVGSGGGGGQANASSASNLSYGVGGGGGAACRHIITDPSAGYNFTLGAYGGNASQGAQSTFFIPGGTDLVVPGGGAGSTVGNSNTLVANGRTNGATVASGGNVWNRGGKCAGLHCRLNGSVAVVGNGGASPGYGVGGRGRTTTGTGEIGHGYGGGGSGGLAINGAGAQAGGHGAVAALIVVEYEAAS